MMPGIQEWIHKFEVGEGTRHVKLVAVILGLLALTAVYDLRNYKNFSTEEAMDTAQLARNISEGKGYTTDFIRPLSVYLLQKVRGEEAPILKEPHPDISNPPVYPYVLSVLMKILPFHFDITKNNRFWRFEPELLIAFFNQGLLFLAVFMIFRLGRRLFDASVGWVSALIFAGTHVFWQFSVSGLSTMLLIVIFLGIVWCLTVMEEQFRLEAKTNAWFIGLSVAVGALVGLGGLTRYAFAWLIFPVAGFLALFFGPKRWVLSGTALAAFVVLISPWLARNYKLSGTLFGTAGFAVYQDSPPSFQGNRLERYISKEIDAELSRFESENYFRKLYVNTRTIIEKDLSNLGGNLISIFFLVGLLLQFRNVALSRMRLFTLMSLALLIVVQAMGRSYLSVDSPQINSENLLVLVAPLAFIFGAGMYFVLLDQINLPFPQLRSAITALFGFVSCLPLILALLPRSHPVAYPPYWPPAIDLVSNWMRDDELMMSDMPWAIAWYGNRQCIWVSLDAPSDSKPTINSDFFRIHDYQKRIHGLYLTSLTTDARFYSQILKDKDYAWGRFMVESLARTNVPKVFPLKTAPRGFLENGQLFLSDRVRWKDETP